MALLATDLPDKLTGSQFTAPEYNIIKNAITAIDEGLQLKVGKDITDGLSNRISSAEASIAITAQQITLRVSKDEFDALGNRVTATESSITQQAGQIALRATKTEVNALTGRITSAEASLVVANNQIATKVSSSVTDALGVRLQSAESTIVQQAGMIQARVTQTDFNALGVRVGSAESTITQQAGQIQAKVSQTTFDALGTRVGTAESTITQQAGMIASKVSQTAFDSLGVRVGSAESSITQFAGQIQSKVSQSTFDSLGNRVSTAETTITQQATQIQSKASQSYAGELAAAITGLNDTLYTTNGRLTTAESTITQQAGLIQSKVSTTTFDALGARVGSAESTITQQSGLISSKVSSTDYNGATIASLINQSPSSIKILAKNINLEGAVTASTFSSGRVKINVNPNGDLEVFHLNGILGIRMGTDETGHAILQGFDDAGNKMWDLDTITQNGGVRYVTTTPDTLTQKAMTKVAEYNGNPPSSGDQTSMKAAIKAIFDYANDPAGYQGYTHIPQLVFIDNVVGTNACFFQAGTYSGSSTVNNGYHTGSTSAGAFLANGWYVEDISYIGKKLHATDWEGPGEQLLPVSVFGISGGQRVAAIQLFVTP